MISLGLRCTRASSSGISPALTASNGRFNMPLGVFSDIGLPTKQLSRRYDPLTKFLHYPRSLVFFLLTRLDIESATTAPRLLHTGYPDWVTHPPILELTALELFGRACVALATDITHILFYQTRTAACSTLQCPKRPRWCRSPATGTRDLCHISTSRLS